MPRHDNCVRLPVSWVTIIRLRVTIGYVFKTNITNKSCLVIKRTTKNTYALNVTQPTSYNRVQSVLQCKNFAKSSAYFSADV